MRRKHDPRRKSFLAVLNKHKAAILSMMFILYFIIVFLILPNVNVILDSFVTGDGISFTNVAKLFRSKYAMSGVKNSIILAIAMSVTVNVVGIFIVLVTEYFEIKGAKILKIGYMSTFVYGGIILVGGYMAIYGDQGVLTKALLQYFPDMNTKWFYGFWGVLFVSTFAGTTNHFLFLTNATKSMDNHLIEAARNLKASPLYIITRVVLPILTPTILAATVLTFIGGLTAFSAPLILGGNDFQTISPLILSLVQVRSGRSLALILGMILGLLTVLLLLVFKRFESGATFFSISKTVSKFNKIKIRNKAANCIVHIFAYLLFVVYTLPLAIVILFSFTNGRAIDTGIITASSFTLDNYVLLLTKSQYFSSYINSIVFSLAASVIAILFVFLAVNLMSRYKNRLVQAVDFALLIPWMIPSTLIALGLLTTFDVPNVLVFNQVLLGTVAILILGYTILKIPFTSRMLKAAFAQVNKEYELAAKNLKAKDFYIFRRVIVPILFPTLVAVLALNMNSLLDDYDATVFLYPLKYPTLGVLIRSFTKTESTVDTRAMLYVFSTTRVLIASSILYIAYGVLLSDKRGRHIGKIKAALRTWIGKLANRLAGRDGVESANEPIK